MSSVCAEHLQSQNLGYVFLHFKYDEKRSNIIFTSLLSTTTTTTTHQVLLFFQKSLQFNTSRTKTTFNRDEYAANNLASDSFSLNLASVLLRLCIPFADVKSKAAKKIDAASFLLSSKARNVAAFDMSEDLICGGKFTQDREDKIGDLHFVSQVYFLTLHALRLGPVQILRKVNLMMQQFSHIQRMLNQNPSDSRLQMQHGLILARKCVYDCALLEPDVVNATLRFISLTMGVLVHLAGGTESLDDPKITIELPRTPNETWRAVPQHFVDDTFDLLIYIGRERGHLLDSVSMDSVMDFLVLFLTHPTYIRSPHLRAKFGELLFSVFLPNSNQSKNPLAKPSVQCALLLSTHDLACTCCCV